MSDLAERKCIPCRGDTPPLRGQALYALHNQLSGWEVVAEHHLKKTYRFPDFKTALAFVDRLGAIAEAEGHHPDIHLAWGKAVVEVWTHAIDGLSESDFVLAAKADRAAAQP